MTVSNDFWARKMAQEQQKLNPHGLTAPKQALTPQITGPWWRAVPAPSQEPEHQETVYGQPNQKVMIGEIEITLDANGEYNPRGASHKKRSGSCPECGSGNFGRGEDTSRAARCFDCGHVDGRNIADANRPIGISSEAPSQRTRQTAAGGAVKNNYKGEISDLSQAVGRIT